MELKASKYNFIVNEGADTIAFNAKNCALVKVNADFLSILENPNSEITAEQKILRENMYNAGFLIDEAVDELKVLEFKYWKSKFETDALTITIMPTDACNFACFYCFENKQQIRMTPEIVTATIDFVKKNLFGVKNLRVCWFGGEPLLAADIVWEISEALIEIAAANSCEYSAFIVTNGYLLDDEIISNLKKYKIETLQITVDGDKSAHDKRRCLKSGGATFDKILANVKKIVDNNLKIALRVNVDKSNAETIEPLIKRLSAEFGTNKNNVEISFGQILPIARTDEWDTSLCLSTAEYTHWTEIFKQIMMAEGFQIKNKYPFYPAPKLNFCGADQIKSFIIRPNGNIDKCWDCERIPVGDVKRGVAHNVQAEQNLSVWMLHSPFDDDECRNCKVLPICMGGCPYFAIERKSKLCLKWRYDIENIIRQKYLRHTQGR